MSGGGTRFIASENEKFLLQNYTGVCWNTIHTICFGSEAGDLAQLDRVASVLVERQDEIETQTAARLRDGVSYPVARSSVVAGFLPETPPNILASPNNILGI